MCDDQYISADDVTEADVEAAERGELVRWRRGPDGTQWFRRLVRGTPDHDVLRAIPPTADAASEFDEGDDDELIDDDAEGAADVDD